MLTSRQYRHQIAFRKTIEDALFIDAPDNMRALFAEMATKSGKPKFLNTLSPAILDTMYEEYAPERWLSKTGATVYSDVNDVLTHSGSLSTLADILITAYGQNWDKIWDAYTASYKPLENYNMKEKTSYNSTQNHNGADTLTMEGKEYDIKAGKEISTKAGKEINTKSGKEYDIKAGKEISTKAGKEISTKAGKEINTKSGKEFDIKAGKEFNIKAGKEINKKEGAESTVYNSDTENQVSAFNSSTYQDATKAIHEGSDYMSYGNIIINGSVTPAERKDTLEFGTGTDERKDTLEYGTGADERKDTHEFGTGNDARKDTLEFGTGDDARKDTLEFGTGNDARKDTLEFGTGADERKDTHEFGTGADARKDIQGYNSAVSHSGYDELERSGNIGVTTSQQMLQSEIELRQYNFIMAVFRDVTDLLGLPIY